MRASISLDRMSRQAAMLVLLLLAATAAYAQFTPSDDAYVSSSAPTTNYGAAKTLDLSSAADTVFIRFDLTAVPSGYTGASVAKATLKLYADSCTKAGSFNVDLVNGTWTERSIDYTNQPALGTTIAASVPLVTTNKLVYVEVDVTQAVVDWLNGTQANDGLALVANSPLVATFDSKESTTTSHPPELDIVFAGGSGSGITGVLTGAASGLTGGGTSGTLNISLLTSCSSGQVLAWNGSAWECASPSGGGTITGVTAGTDLTGGGTSGNVTLNLNTSLVPQLNTANTFTGNQTVNGNLSATGLVTGTAFDIGSNLFAFGSYTTANAFLGFAGNSTTTGTLNTASGENALFSNTSGGTNTAVGSNALYANTTGNANVAIGGYALSSNTTGYGNTASGDSALGENTTGGTNTATGIQALYSNTTGSYNSGNGTEALYTNTTGFLNTASGYQTLYGNTTGPANTAIGSYALQYNTTGGFNTALGYNAGTDQNSPSLNNATAIGANADVTQSNSLVLGSINGVNGSNANTNVGIGTTAPQYALDVHGTGNFTGLVNFASGQQFPGAGTITGVTAGTALTGGGSSGNVTLNVDTTKVVTGVVAGTDLTGGGTGGNVTLNLNTANVPLLAAANAFTGNQTVNGNVSATGTVTGGSFGIGSNLFAFGSYSLGNAFLGFAGNATITGNDNTAIGYGALSSNTMGSDNTAVGVNALFANTGSGENTAIGLGALFSNSTGSGNTATGTQSLISNTTGMVNTASGYQALFYNTSGGNNTAEGYQSLYSNTTGNYNTATGVGALQYNVSGANNTAAGYQALYNNTVSGNTAYGYQALYSNVGDSLGDGAGNTAVGYRALYLNKDLGIYGGHAALSNTAVGSGALYNNTVGYENTASGTGALVANTTGSLNTAVGDQALGSNTTGNGLTCIGYNCTASEDGLQNATAIGAHAVVGASNSLVLGGTGKYAVKVGIGTTTPSNVLTIAQGAGQPLSDGWATFSSRRWKTNIHTLHDALGIVEQLRGVSYDLKATGQHEVGVIAEEVGAVVPEVVTWEKNGKDAQSVDYGRLTALLIEATKEQQALIREQKEQIRAQQAQIVRLTRKVKTIETTIKVNGQNGSAVRMVKAEAGCATSHAF